LRKISGQTRVLFFSPAKRGAPPLQKMEGFPVLIDPNKCTPFKIAKAHAIKLIRAWNKGFEVTSLECLSDDQLWLEFATEYLLFKSGRKRVSVTHISVQRIYYRPVIDSFLYVENERYYCTKNLSGQEMSYYANVIFVVKPPLIVTTLR
jgi:hypothetical protein